MALIAVALCLILLAVLLITRCAPAPAPTEAPTETPEQTAEPTPEPTPTPIPTPTPAPSRITVMSLGDIMFQSEQLAAARSGEDYDFAASLSYIRDSLAKADLVIGNLEGVCAGEAAGYGDPFGCNIPDSAVRALAEAGVDVLTVANENIFAYGTEAAVRTAELIRGNGLGCVGIRTNMEEPPYLIREIKGKRVAVLAFSYSYGQGTAVPASMYVEYTSQKICASIKEAKNAGADLVVVQMHWGDEFSDETLYAQKVLAQDMLEAGADSIFGSHAHIVQELQRKSVSYKGANKEIFVCYGLGNFLSSQRSTGRDRGIIGGAAWSLDGRLTDTFYLPVWVQKNDISDVPVYRVLPAGVYALSETRPVFLSPNDFDAVKAAWNEITAVLGTEKARPEAGVGGGR